MSDYEQIDLNKISTYSIAQRLNKVAVTDFAKPYRRGASFQQFFASLPGILVSADFKHLVQTAVQAHRDGRQLIAMMGAHVIKCGLSPLIIQLMEAGIIRCLALNGAGIIHDSEIANWGTTSEDVAEALQDGSFGMAAETPAFINDALESGHRLRLGLGEAVGKKIWESDCQFKHLSVLAAGYRLKIPVTVHVAIGTDIIHQHPSTDGKIVGELSYRDFKIFTSQVAKLSKGSLVLNFGSAVILPEVFLKALSIARNLGYPAHGFTTANFDMIRHYRPQVNVVQRPTQTGGQGYYFIGHHEIMIPLLTAAILEAL
ncbi:MAG: hypothetical protein ONB33_08590 [candidate division KSB1 bacterium]|nr:hypothetical protein [candidate division KSB1 bacterium]MDZ7357645.1 hypothetical protein [candidate division KSB1 bacterium]MDZ7399211.1 hypothetical protein [candidate division KSB1 bacterium]